MALADVNNGESIRSVANKYGINREKLRRATKDEHPNKAGGPTALSAAVEEALELRLLVLAGWGQPFDALDLRFDALFFQGIELPEPLDGLLSNILRSSFRGSTLR